MAADAVVVGVDGSDVAMDAVSWAAEEAALRRRALRVVHGFLWPAYGAGGAFMYDPAVTDLRDAADAVVTAAIEHAKQAVPEVECTGEVIPGAAAPTLIRESRGAELLVVGSRGLGGFTGLLVGSVGVTVAAHAASPVVVVRPRTTGRGVGAGRVVVGVDGSETAGHAVRFAFEEATRRRVGLTAVYGGEGDLPAADADAAHAAGVRLLADALAECRERHPEVDVTEHVLPGPPAQALIDAGEGALLVVVGSRGRGGFRGLLLGSVSQALLHHAPGPVAIVRMHAGDAEPAQD